MALEGSGLPCSRFLHSERLGGGIVEAKDRDPLRIDWDTVDFRMDILTTATAEGTGTILGKVFLKITENAPDRGRFLGMTGSSGREGRGKCQM